MLYDHGDMSTAVALSMFGREELGRSNILRKLAKSVTEGEHLSPEDVRGACENHMKKQAAGALSTILRTQAPNQLDAALRVRVDPGSEEWQQASKVVDLATDLKRKRQPQDRHEMRESALYVDLDATGTAWLRPSTLNSAQCLDEITDAVNDYAGERDRLRDEVLDLDFPEMVAARANMDPKVMLPEPRWPKENDMSDLAPKDRTELLLKLADASWRDFDQRRSYEWKSNFALWTGLGILSGYLLSRTEPLSCLLAVFITVILSLIGAIYGYLWTPHLRRRNREDQVAAHFYWGLLDQAMGINSPNVRKQFAAESPVESHWKNWSHGSQIAFTFLFLIAAILAAWVGGRKG